MQSLLRRITLAGSLLLCVVGLAPAQRPATSIAVDASSLDDILTLPGPFATETNDDPSFADPNFDDSAWPNLKPNQALATGHLTGPGDSYVWVRIHLYIVNAHGPLGIAVGHLDYPYTVYANGREIASSAGMDTRTLKYDPPFAIDLPEAQEITLAVRLYHSNAITRSPLKRMQIGHLSGILAATELSRIHAFDVNDSFEFMLAAVLFFFGIFSLILYLAQRQRSEYLWLALFCFFKCGYANSNSLQEVGILSVGFWGAILTSALGYYSCLCSLEFVIRFVHAKARWPVRAVEMIFLLGPLQTFLAPNLRYIVLVPAIWLWVVSLCYFTVLAFRSRDLENRVLLPPTTLYSFVIAWSFSAGTLPVDNLYFPAPVQIERIGIDLINSTTFLFLAGVLAVVLYRFIRVTRDEQRAAGELEAARTIQNILIPEILPEIPGYAITSVYQPAQEVGGDFFQIIPLSAAAFILLGDVAGKGMQAAMTVSLIVGAVRAAAEMTTSPAELLGNLNRRLYGRSTGFTTCLILRITADGDLSAANAGHLQPYLDGKEWALEPGLPLGFVADFTYPESGLTMAPNQTLTLLTDGIVEATSITKELFGFERTESVSQQTAQQIAAAATAFAHPAPQADDITVLTLRRLPT